jgi:hypothetical protein
MRDRIIPITVVIVRSMIKKPPMASPSGQRRTIWNVSIAMRKERTTIRKEVDLSNCGIFLTGLTSLRYVSAKDPLGQYQLHHCLPRIVAIPTPATIQRGIK